MTHCLSYFDLDNMVRKKCKDLLGQVDFRDDMGI